LKDKSDAERSVSIDTANRVSTNTALAYDDNGNLLSDGTYQYVRNARNQLVRVRQGRSSLVTDTYDPLVRRSTRQMAGTAPVSFVMDGMNVVGEATPGNYKQFVNGDGVDDWLSVYDGAGARHFVRDALNSVVGTFGSGGSFSNPYTYSPFGVTSGTASDNYAYTGRAQDLPDLYFYRARYYKPSTARFISEDPIQLAGEMNNYNYVEGSPIGFNDPMGLVLLPGQAPVKLSRR